jgi:hypothetical protein
MTKKILLVMMAVAFSTAAMSQSMSSPGVKVGIRGGLNLAQMKYEPQDQTNGMPNGNSLASYNLGLVLDFGIINGLSIQTGAGISGKGSKVEWSSGSFKYTEKMNPMYVEVPLDLVFKPQIGPSTRLYFGVGPYLGIGVAGKASFTGNTPVGNYYSDHTLKFGNDNNDDLKRTDIGGEVMAGFEFNGITLGARYGLSFTNNAPTGNNNAAKILKNKVLSIDAGFFFQ